MPTQKTIYCCSYGCGQRSDHEQEMVSHESKCPYRPENAPRSTWQPMETAPKDGTMVALLLYSRDGYSVAIGNYSKSPAGAGWKIDGCIQLHNHPEKWLYIPPIPEK